MRRSVASAAAADMMLVLCNSGVAISALVPAALALAVLVSPAPAAWLTALLVAGLLAFGAVFAVTPSRNPSG